MKVATFICMGEKVGALQWLLKMEDIVIATLAPTSQNPIKSFHTMSGVLFQAKRNENTLQLSFKAKPAAGMFKAVCSDSFRISRKHCDIILPGKWHPALNLHILIFISSNAGHPSSPTHKNSTTFANNTVLLSWFPPSDDPLCVEHYMVNVTSEYNTLVNTTRSTFKLLGPLEPGKYVFSVAGVDGLNRTGEYYSVSQTIKGVSANTWVWCLSK